MSNPNHDPKTGEFASSGNTSIASKIAADHKPVGWHIVHKHTGKVVGKARTFSGSERSLDRHDNAYGGYIHRKIPVYDESKF